MKKITKSKNMEQSDIDISNYSKTEQNILKKYIGYTGLHAEIVQRNKSKITKSTIHIETGIPKIVRDTAIDNYNDSKPTVKFDKATKNCWEISFCQVNKPFKSLNDKDKKFLKEERENHPDYKTSVKIVCDAILAYEKNKTSNQNKSLKTNNKKSKQKKPKYNFIPYESPKVGQLRKNKFQNDFQKLRNEVQSLEIKNNVKMKSNNKNNREYDPNYDYYYEEAFKEAKNRKSCTTPTPKKWLVWLSRYEYLTKLTKLRKTHKNVKAQTLFEDESLFDSSKEHKNEDKKLNTNGIGSDHVKAAYVNGSIG